MYEWTLRPRNVIVILLQCCIYIGTMSLTSAVSVVDENFADENLPANKSASEYKVVSPQRSVLKDSNVCNVINSSPCASDTVKVKVCG